MGDAVQTRALLGDLTRRLGLAGLDELRVVDRVLLVLERRRERDGELDLARSKEVATDLASATIAELAAEDAARAQLVEDARLEILDLATTIATAGSRPDRVVIPADRVDIALACGLDVDVDGGR